MTTPHIVLGTIVLALLATSYAAPSLATDAVDQAVGPVFVSDTQIESLESHPLQVQLVVTGTVPTPCHTLVAEAQDLGDRVDVRLWSVADPAELCAQVLSPFELRIPLGSFKTASLPVLLNGEAVGHIAIGDSPDEPTLSGAGWSFGFCAHYCKADLVVTGDSLVLTGGDNGAAVPLYTHKGTMTSAGITRLDAALADLEGVSLEPIYGCPDCADGGAAYLALTRNGATERALMGFANPPDVLADLYAMSAEFISALETCQSNKLVEVGADCSPFEA